MSNFYFYTNKILSLSVLILQKNTTSLWCVKLLLPFLLSESCRSLTVSCTFSSWNEVFSFLAVNLLFSLPSWMLCCCCTCNCFFMSEICSFWSWSWTFKLATSSYRFSISLSDASNLLRMAVSVSRKSIRIWVIA